MSARGPCLQARSGVASCSDVTVAGEARSGRYGDPGGGTRDVGRLWCRVVDSARAARKDHHQTS